MRLRGLSTVKEFHFTLEAMGSHKKRSGECQSGVCFEISHCAFRMNNGLESAQTEVGRRDWRLSGKMMVTK